MKKRKKNIELDNKGINKEIKMEKIKVLIADDVQIIRQGLKAILEQSNEIEVVATASDGKTAYEKCQISKPDVVLMDMRMPEYDGAYGISTIKSAMPKVKVLVLTTFDDDETVAKAIESGADGYILKEMEDEQVISSIKNVHAGISVFGTKIFQMMKCQMGQKPGTEKKSGNQVEEYKSVLTGKTITFTEKEVSILKLVADGYDNKEIAKELFVAEGTARNSISRLLEKVEVKDRTQLAVYAVKNGLDLSSN